MLVEFGEVPCFERDSETRINFYFRVAGGCHFCRHDERATDGDGLRALLDDREKCGRKRIPVSMRKEFIHPRSGLAPELVTDGSLAQFQGFVAAKRAGKKRM